MLSIVIRDKENVCNDGTCFIHRMLGTIFVLSFLKNNKLFCTSTDLLFKHTVPAGYTLHGA